MKNIGLLFPHQLFKEQPLLEHAETVWLIEDSLFFGDKHNPLRFHKLKLAFHRASMKSYQAFLESQGVDVVYIEYDPSKTIRDNIPKNSQDAFWVIDPTDYLLERRLRASCKNITILPSPLFLNTKEENQEFLSGRKNLLMHHFYQWQRKRFEILLTPEGKPLGGAWSHDKDNRKKLPKSEYETVPNEPPALSNTHIKEALVYIEAKFPDNPGSLTNFIFPIDHKGAWDWFEQFLDERFRDFGPYEDAMTQQHTLMYHSLLSPLLNSGLLPVWDVVNKSLSYAAKHQMPLNSIEGFIRQIIGWREYSRMMYEAHGTEMRTSNAWKHNEPLPESFYTGDTGLEPVDTVIQRTQTYAYAHHIERLMILGNCMFLLQVQPNDVYRWFMEMFIDAYDWVMVPNVYGMSQHASKGLMTTKPYISGSNYIRKMSDYGSGPWSDIWDALYWSWVVQHKKELRKEGRMHFVISRADSFSHEEEKKYHHIVKEFRQSL